MKNGLADGRGQGEAVPELRFLKMLVGGLALVMGAGIIAIVAILWLRLGATALPELPERIALPEGATAAAVTFARDWTVVVTEAGEILLYDARGQLARQVTPGG